MKPLKRIYVTEFIPKTIFYFECDPGYTITSSSPAVCDMGQWDACGHKTPMQFQYYTGELDGYYLSFKGMLSLPVFLLVCANTWEFIPRPSNTKWAGKFLFLILSRDPEIANWEHGY